MCEYTWIVGLSHSGDFIWRPSPQPYLQDQHPSTVADIYMRHMLLPVLSQTHKHAHEHGDGLLAVDDPAILLLLSSASGHIQLQPTRDNHKSPQVTHLHASHCG